MTVAGDGTLINRRRVDLVDEGLPKIPHHGEGQSRRRCPCASSPSASHVPRAATNHCRAAQGLPGAELLADWVTYHKALAAAA